MRPESRESCERYPLDLSVCGECSLLQVTCLPPIGRVFHEDYRYSSSTIPSLVRHFAEYAQWLQGRVPAAARVLEFGCNDGVLLCQLAAAGMRCTGVDASENVATLARAQGLHVYTDFFTPDFVRRHRFQTAFDVVTCSNVFAHIHDVRSCARAAWDALAPGGQFCVEVHNASSIFESHHFDTIYHEHLTYYTSNTLTTLLQRAGFEIEEVARTSMHGDGLRVLARRSAQGPITPTPVGATQFDFQLVGREIKDAIDRCAATVRRLKQEHGLLHAYGAAGRSQMFLNFTATADCFDVVYDDSPMRQGRYIAGTDLQIRPYANERGNCCVILAWNYAPDIAAKLKGQFDAVMTVLPEESRW
jgi:SAM-dependent methyltransferase